MKLTDTHLKELCNQYAIPYACLKAVVEVEAGGSGFSNGLPKILYEPHIMHRLLTKANKITIRNTMMSEQPKLCYPNWGRHKYGKTSEQHGKLQIAAKYDRDCALQSCSWGLGQIMGFHWKSLNYSSLQAFVNAMYKDEKSQLDAMIRFLQVNNLITPFNNKDWHRFAKGYNGAGYLKNSYHTKLANSYNKYK